MPVLIFVFWIALNGRLAWDVLVIGIAVSALVSVFTYRFLGVSIKTSQKMWSKIGSIIGYLFTLLIEVIKSNIYMIRLILSSDIGEIKPQIIYFQSPVRTQHAQVGVANSITLTPGTITIKLDEDEFGVHAIDAPLGDGIENSVFVNKMKKIEGGHSDV